MKKKHFLSCVLLSSIFTLYGCNDKLDNNPVSIVATFDKMYLDLTDSYIIQSQEQLKEIVSDAKLTEYPEIQQIDFSNYSLLIGYIYAPELISAKQITHSFIHESNRTYTYHILVQKNEASADEIDKFNTGVIIEKIPEYTDIKFKTTFSEWND